MKMFLKKVLCFFLAFQLSGCAQAAMQMRREQHTKVEAIIEEIEVQCVSEEKKKLDALEAKIQCLKENVPSALEKEKYADADIISLLYDEQLNAIEQSRAKKISFKKLQKRLAELDKKAIADLGSRETQRQIRDRERDKALASILAVAAVGTAAYYACKDGGCGGGGYQSQNLQGCCSWHGGVNSCYAGRVVCNDGQFSPSCRC